LLVVEVVVVDLTCVSSSLCGAVGLSVCYGRCSLRRECQAFIVICFLRVRIATLPPSMSVITALRTLNIVICIFIIFGCLIDVWALFVCLLTSHLPRPPLNPLVYVALDYTTDEEKSVSLTHHDDPWTVTPK
jgi:hypothetical protein